MITHVYVFIYIFAHYEKTYIFIKGNKTHNDNYVKQGMIKSERKTMSV